MRERERESKKNKCNEMEFNEVMKVGVGNAIED